MNFKNFTIAIFILIPFVNVLSQTEPDTRNLWTGGQRGYKVFGDISVIKNQSVFSVKVDPNIEKMGVKEEPDSVYVAKRVKEYNENKAGSGDKWLKEWEKSKSLFKDAFIEGFNKYIAYKNIKMSNDNTQTMYTFIVYPKALMEFMGKTYIYFDLKLVNTENPAQTILTIRCPVNNSQKKTKLSKDKSVRAFKGGGYLFAKYCAKHVFI